MPRWPWIERTFRFDFPPEKFPDLLERWRGAPARIEERTRGLSDEILCRRERPGTWSIKENVGHLIDLGYLASTRLQQILDGVEMLVAADMTNRATHSSGHNDKPIELLCREFRDEREAAVRRFEAVDASDWGRSGVHPRLKQPMRIVDILYFDSEHDDYHIARIAELRRLFEEA